MHIGHVGPTTQQPHLQPPAPSRVASTSPVKARTEEQSESKATAALESGQGENINKIA